MNRIEKLRQHLDEHNQTSFLVFDQHNVTYISGFCGHATTLLITPKKQYLITDYRYFEQAKTQATGFSVICRDRVNQSLENLVTELLNKESIEILAYEAAHVSVAQWQDFSLALGNIKTVATQGIVEALRYVKDSQEIDYIRKAADIADQALAQLLPLLKEGVTERSMALELEYNMSKLGSECPAFDTILLFGERSALPHGVPGERTLKQGDLILCDFGATINGYRSDMTRTYVLGEPSFKQKEIYRTVLKAQAAAISAIKDGVTGEYLNAKSQAILNESPYAQYQGEGLGHGVGLDLHESPFIGKVCRHIIKKGCVITIEPGIYIPDWGGIRIEDDVVLTEQGLEILNNSPKSLLSL